MSRGHGYELDDLDLSTDLRLWLRECARERRPICLIGPPGAGKTMIARRLPTLLPEVEGEDRVVLAIAYGDSGRNVAPWRPPFRAPHHTCSEAGLVGSVVQRREALRDYDPSTARTRVLPAGRLSVYPGELTLAHRGVLFLDELPEFRRQALDRVIAAAARGYVAHRHEILMPCATWLVAASNPCPCGWHGDEERRCCVCGPDTIARYLARIPPTFVRMRIQRVRLGRKAV